MKIGSYTLLTEKLEPTFLETFRQVEMYGTLHMVPESVMAEKMMDLLDTMLAAQEAGSSVEQVVGMRIQDFCMNFFSDVSGKDIWQKLFENLRTIFRLIFALELMFVALSCIDNGADSLWMDTNVKPYLVGFVAAWGGNLISALAGRRAIRRGKYRHWKYLLVNVLSAVVFGVAAYFLLDQFPPMMVKTYVMLAVSGGYVILDALVSGVVRFRRTGDFRKRKNDYEITFTGAMKQELQSMDFSRDLSVVKTFAKRYARINRRREKKGLLPLDTPMFLKKDYRKDKLFLTLMPLEAGVVVFLFMIFSEEGFNLIIFLAILCVMTLPLAWILQKLLKINAKEIRDIQAACALYGVELDEYAKMLEDGKI